MSASKADLLTSLRSGSFFEDFSSREKRRNTKIKEIAELVAGFHDSGEFDFFEILKKDALEKLERWLFFDIIHLYCEVVKIIRKGNGRRIFSSGKILSDIAGDDLVSRSPQSSFKIWCSRDSGRLKKLLKEVESDPNLSADELSVILQAGASIDATYYTDKAIVLLESSDEELKFGAISALSEINFDNSPEKARIGFVSLSALVNKDCSERISLGAIHAALSLHLACGQEPRYYLESARVSISRFSVAKGVVFAAMSKYSSRLDEVLCEKLFETLLPIDPNSAREVFYFDSALANCSERLSKQLFAVILHSALSEPDLSFEKLPNIKDLIQNEDNNILCWIIVKWFRSGGLKQRRDISEFVNEIDSDAPLLVVDFSEFNFTDRELVFICRKSMGFLWMAPRTTAAFILQAFRAASEAVYKELEEILFLLCKNFPSSTTKELCKYQESGTDQQKKCIARALKRLRTYQDHYNRIGTVKELLPTARQRRIATQKKNEMFEVARKQAEKQSIFFNLVSRSTLLYGATAVAFAEGKENKRERILVPMQKHTISVEYPRMSAIDPVGYRYQLHVFQVERLDNEADT